MSNKQLTPTSFAILGLLSIQPFTTYELAQQMDRTVSWFWPRAASMVYEEPKKLVTAGLATSQASFTGKRRSTVYEITDAGRDGAAGLVGRHPPRGCAWSSKPCSRWRSLTRAMRISCVRR